MSIKNKREMTLCEKQAEDGRDGFQLLEGAMLTYNENKGKSKKIKRRTVAQKSKGMNEVFGNEENGGKGTEDGKNDGGDDGQEEEEIQRLRRVHRIFTWGLNIPRPISDFASVPLPDKLRANLRDFNQPTPVQMQGIPIGLLHRDHLITAPTGSGKTLSFAIPLIVRALDNRKKRSVTIGQCANDIHSLCAVVIEPTKILAKQTYENFLKFCDGLDINCEYLREEGIGEKCDILVTTPNRFIFALEKLSKDGQKKTKIVEGLQWLILDECDRMFDRTEGEASFRVQLSKILSLCNGNETRCGFYSATFSYEVEEWCKENFQEVAMICIGPRNSANELVKQELLFVGWEQAKVSAVRDIVRGGFDPPALLFLQSKDRAKQLFVELSESCNAIPVGLISGELTEEECELVVERFRSGKIWLLICTELMGRGIDFQEVNMVINFDLPTSIVSYIHRIGRTGRAGRIGRAITLFTESDLPIIRPIATVIRQAGFTVPEYLLRLNKPSKKSQKKLKRMAPKRKNLLPNWNKLKRKVSIGVKESKIKKLNERRRKKQRRHSENGKGRERKTDIEKADANRMQSLSNIEQGTKEETKTHNSRGGRNGRHERNKPKRERGDGH